MINPYDFISNIHFVIFGLFVVRTTLLLPDADRKMCTPCFVVVILFFSQWTHDISLSIFFTDIGTFSRELVQYKDAVLSV